MHLAVYWHVRVGGEPAKTVGDAIREVLKGYSWVRPLDSYYVIQVGGEADRAEIHARLLQFARANAGTVRYVITPLMQGKYTGFLPKTMWTKLSERTGK